MAGAGRVTRDFLSRLGRTLCGGRRIGSRAAQHGAPARRLPANDVTSVAYAFQPFASSAMLQPAIDAPGAMLFGLLVVFGRATTDFWQVVNADSRAARAVSRAPDWLSIVRPWMFRYPKHLSPA